MARLDISIDTDSISALVKKGSDIEMTEEAQNAIMNIVAIRDRAEAALEMVKLAIVKQGIELSEDFKGVVGDTVKGYVKKADKYEATDKKIVPDEVMKPVSYKRLDQEAVEEYRKKEGKLPKGVSEKENVTSFVLLYDKKRAKEMQAVVFGDDRLDAGKT